MLREKKNDRTNASELEREGKKDKVVQEVTNPKSRFLDVQFSLTGKYRSLLLKGGLYYLHAFEHLLFLEPSAGYLHAKG